MTQLYKVSTNRYQPFRYWCCLPTIIFTVMQESALWIPRVTKVEGLDFLDHSYQVFRSILNTTIDSLLVSSLT